ncbi:MAG: TIGR03943 family protein, partial [Leptolyngbyaceae cyanobacterium RM1_405_57]|nr:TIGR03943 family protein [Leptolyngbyaceae cyanobacterium RM1_405_57]
RFVITCCAADTYPVGLPVKIEGSRSTYPPDTWLRVKGSMITETLDGQRQLTIQASQLEEIEEPENPYEY